MVALDTRGGRDPLKALSPATVKLLSDAIAARWTGGEDADGLKTALEAAASEAHARSLSPEAVIIALKAIEEETAARWKGRQPDADERRKCREWLVTACLKAYFAP